jgi:hypothetical protein
MIIKEAEDRHQQVELLQGLLAHPEADAGTRKRIEREILNIKAGIRGEEEAAYEIKVRWGDSKNWMILHDLRIEHGGVVAQIDHLLINRLMEFWVCESKHFAEGIAINEHGECSAFWGNRPYGVPSPIEQNNKHILILSRLLDSELIKLPTRLGFTIKPALKSLVLVSKGARISRPKKKIDGLEAIIKNDQLFKTIEKAIDGSNPLIMAKFIGQDTVKDLAEKIAACHKPIQFNWAAKFGLSPWQPSPEAQVAPQQAAPHVIKPKPAEPLKPAPKETGGKPTEDAKKPKQKLECQSCGVAVNYSVAKFCWFNKPRFGGNIYCMDCQKKV